MEDEEIEAWYDEEKEKLTEKYKNLIQKSNNKEKLEKKFIKEIEDLHKKYEYLMNKNIKKNLKLFFLNYRLEKIKKKILQPFYNLKEKLLEKKKN